MINNTQSPTQAMTVQTRETATETPDQKTSAMPATLDTEKQTPDASINQRAISEAKTVDRPIVASLTFLNKLRKQAEKAGIEPAVFCRLNHHGILGKLFSEEPATTKDLCKLRLNALKEDIDATFSGYANWVNGRKSQATHMLIEMEAALKDADNNPFVFMNLLSQYETTFNKVSLRNILDAKFMMIDGAEKLDPLKVISEGTFISVEDALINFHSNKGRTLALKDNQNAEETIAKASLIHVLPGSKLTETSLLNTYIQTTPELIANMITTWINSQLLLAESFMIRCLANSALNMDTTATDVERMLSENEDLRHDITTEVSRLHTGRLYQELSAFDTESASAEALVEARQQCCAFDQLQAEFREELSASEIKQQQTSLKTKQVEIAAHMIHLLAISEAAKPTNKRLFLLKAPSIEQVAAKLASTELMTSTEKQLYQHMLTYMDALQSFKNTGDHASMTRMQQTRFDLLRTQQEKLIEEMNNQTAGHPDNTVLGSGHFETDMTLLENIHQVRQTTAKFRPVNTFLLPELPDNILRLGGNVIWRDERPLNDIKASLVHNHHLSQLGYGFNEELMAVCGGSKETFDQVCTGISSIASKTATEAKGLLAGKVGLFQAIGLGVNAYRGIQATFGETLKDVLKTAERNPTAFRRMCGDFAQLVPQLKILAGAGDTELNNMLDQISLRLSAESVASCFAGDEAVNLNETIDPASDMAKNLKRFQFFCDLSSGMLRGTAGLNTIKAAVTGSPLGLAGALFNIGTMVVTREAVNRMPAHEVRMLDKLFRYGPVYGWNAISPFDFAATTARGIAQNKGIIGSVTCAILAPYMKRVNALTEAIRNVYNHKPDAWAALALEGAKTTAVLAATLGVTCIAASTVCTPGLLGTVGCALTAGEMIASFSYGTARLISYLEDNHLWTHAAQSIEAFTTQYFSGNSKVAKSIRLRCQQEAASMVAGMKNMDAYQQQTSDLAARKLLRTHQDRVTNPQSYKDQVASFLLRNTSQRKEQVNELAQQVQVLELIEKNMNQATEISKSKTGLSELRTQLKALNITHQLPESGLVHFMLNLKQEITASIERQCGTDTPGTTTEQIEETLVSFQTEVMLGSVVRETMMLEDAQEVERIKTEAETELCRKATGNIARIEQQRIKLMYMEAMKQYIADKQVDGEEVTVDDLKKKDLETTLQTRVERMLAELRTVNGQRIARFETQVNALPIMQKLSEPSRDRIFTLTASTQPAG